MKTRQPRQAHDRRTFLATTTAGFGALAAVATEEPRAPGDTLRPTGEPSAFEKLQRDLHESRTPGNGWNYTPLQDLYGIITPSAVHFEQHHAGVPRIDPRAHELRLHGAVARPLAFTMSDLRRLPSVSRVHFIECAGNTWTEHRGTPAANPQRSHGLVSCSEWTGVQTGIPQVDSAIARATRSETNHTLSGQDLNNFAPRVGFAYPLDEKSVIRGGYGIYYDRPSAAFMNTVFSNYPHLREAEITRPSAQIPYADAWGQQRIDGQIPPFDAWFPFFIRYDADSGSYGVFDSTGVPRAIRPRHLSSEPSIPSSRRRTITSGTSAGSTRWHRTWRSSCGTTAVAGRISCSPQRSTSRGT